MKLTKRIKRGIIQSTLFSGGFCILLIGIFLFSLYPKITEIGGKKQELTKRFNDYNNVLKNGLGFAEFKAGFKGGNNDAYSNVLLANIDESFYTSHFTNSEFQNYDEFLDSIQNDLELEKSSPEYVEKQGFIDKFLPTYFDSGNSGARVFSDQELGEDISNTLSDFYFINYIENLLYSFNIEYTGNIGVGDLIPIGDQQEGQSEISNILQEDIYAIPLSLSLVGRKADIVDFLHYFENVSRIQISEDGFTVYEDDFIQKRIEGSSGVGGYNIYENQLSDIVSFSSTEYPSTSIRSGNSLSESMKTLQAKEKYEIDVELHFYVAGVPGYRMQSYVTNLLDSYTLFATNLKRDTEKYTNQKYKFSSSVELTAIQTLKNLERLVVSLDTDMQTLRRLSLDRTKIGESFDEATKLNNQLDKLYVSYNQQLQLLDK